MAETDQDQKTEQATEKRLSEAHERGQFAKSHELMVLFPIAAALGVLTLTAQPVSRDIAEYSVGMVARFASTPVDRDTVVVQLGGGLLILGRALGPILLSIVGATLLAT